MASLGFDPVYVAEYYYNIAINRCACLKEMAERKFFVGGNWKMNGSKAVVDDLVKMLNDRCANTNTGTTVTISLCGQLAIVPSADAKGTQCQSLLCFLIMQRSWWVFPPVTSCTRAIIWTRA